MPSGTTIARKLQEEGIQKVDAFLTSICNARRLASDAVEAVTRSAMLVGWEFEIQAGTGVRRLQVLLDKQFPFSIPNFFLVDRPPYLTWPHIERDGFLCLVAGTKAARPRYPAEIIGELLADAFDLICDCETQQNLSDFQTGFHTYWSRSVTDEDIEILSLLNLDGKSRFVQIWSGKTTSVIGESQAQVLAWQKKRHGEQPQFDTTDTALLLWLPQPLLPSQYPNTAADLYRLAQTTKRGKGLMERFAKIGVGPFFFILAAESRNGPCLAGLRTERTLAVDLRGRRRNLATRGFRPGKVPTSLVAFRLFSPEAKATRIIVERVDSAWIHGRDRDKNHNALAQKKLLLIGCGSVGGFLAQQLAMAGVGSIRILDPDLLSWANVGRHPLGAEYVDHSKAVALADKLQKSYPHAQIEGFRSTYEAFVLKHPELVQEADLIVSATAEWQTENLLNFQHVYGEIESPILYTWTEPHACAGHAVSIMGKTPCLQCGMTFRGAIRDPVTVWKEVTEACSEPACGAVFQPYGPAELQGTISIATTLALDTLLGKTTTAAHRIWAGPRATLIDAGGDWSDTWQRGHPEREAGGLQVDLPWKKDELCPACSGGAIGVQSPSELGIPPSDLSSLPQSSIT